MPKQNEKLEEKTIYDLKLHEGMDYPCKHFWIYRVAGGWIYFDKTNHLCVFVPFNNEFQL